MKTGELIFRLANELIPVESNAVSKRLNRALIVGLTASMALLVVLYGIRSGHAGTDTDDDVLGTTCVPNGDPCNCNETRCTSWRPGAPLSLHGSRSHCPS